MEIYINDTNILIDLAELELLSAFGRLDAWLYTTDLIVAEIQDTRQREKVEELINAGTLEVLSLESDEFTEIYTIREENSGLTIEDCSVWFAARKYNGTLLTGDARLRKQAFEHGIDVRGIIFIFDELVNNGIMDKQTARTKLMDLRTMNPRLPEKEINARLRAWKK
jgi:predicted nucleic acid-binding protein